MRRLLLALALLPLLGGPAAAVHPDEMLPDQAQELRARELGRGLRCLVCQNQSIDDSDADLAHDLRVIVRERIKAGDDDQTIIRYLVSRYGDYVLLKPPFRPGTFLLWFGPLLILIGALAAAFLFYRRRRIEAASAAPVASSLTDDERTRLDALLGDRS